MDKGDKIKCYCEYCHGKTNHEILAVEKTEGEPYEYEFYIYNCIIKCCGCDLVSFYNKTIDMEAGTYNDEGQWEAVVIEKYYPEINENISLKYSLISLFSACLSLI